MDTPFLDCPKCKDPTGAQEGGVTWGAAPSSAALGSDQPHSGPGSPADPGQGGPAEVGIKPREVWEQRDPSRIAWRFRDRVAGAAGALRPSEAPSRPLLPSCAPSCRTSRPPAVGTGLRGPQRGPPLPGEVSLHPVSRAGQLRLQAELGLARALGHPACLTPPHLQTQPQLLSRAAQIWPRRLSRASTPSFLYATSPHTSSLRLEPATLPVVRASLHPDRHPLGSRAGFTWGPFLCFALSVLQGQRPSPEGRVGVSLLSEAWRAEEGPQDGQGPALGGALLLAAGVERGWCLQRPAQPLGAVPALLALTVALTPWVGHAPRGACGRSSATGQPGPSCPPGTTVWAPSVC